VHLRPWLRIVWSILKVDVCAAALGSRMLTRLLAMDLSLR
jgi:hypothetical protein